MPRKLLFVLPNLFTVSSIFCGVYAITQAAAGSAATGDTASLFFYRAAIAILFGGFFDGCDGRVARLTRTESEFGVQLDSLADVVTFGVAPAILLYEWALAPWHALGVFVCGAYATCGALRLARFNVMAAREEGPGKYFTGLPIPLAAGMVVAIVVAVTQSPQRVEVTPLPVAIVTLVLSWLMVSTVKYHSFKKFKLKARGLLILAGVLASGVVVANRVGPSYILVSYFSAYILVGLGEELLFHNKRKALLAPASSTTHAPLMIEADDEDPEDDVDA
jgi:CDP-diacylglycerol--serine O-phosphatidyltransferase